MKIIAIEYYVGIYEVGEIVCEKVSDEWADRVLAAVSSKYGTQRDFVLREDNFQFKKFKEE